MAIHLPWWAWALGGLLVVLSVVEERQRAVRKARHRAYLRSPEWKERRRGALARARSRCQDCGTTRNLHVHHLTYKRHGNELERDLRVLCRRCHTRRHRDGGRTDDVLDRLIGWVRESRNRQQPPATTRRMPSDLSPEAPGPDTLLIPTRLGMSTLRGVWVRLGIMLALFLLFIRFVVHEPLSVVLPVMCGSVVVVLRLIRRAKRAALGSP